jgi:flagellar basal body rod protein FlgG
MNKFCFFIFIFLAFDIFANDELFNEYNLLYNDLVNFNTNGYKSSWDINTNKGINKINTSQGALMVTDFDTVFDIDFAIVGNGFFKIRLENNVIGYTRYGRFSMSLSNSDSEFTLKIPEYGYELYDPIVIPNNTVKLIYENYTLFALLIDDTKKEVGRINIYDVDDEKLIRYKDNIFITLDNYEGKKIIDLKIIKGCLEMSNVSVIETLMRMHIILWELKNNGYNYDDKDQIILMLINNIPILNELEAIKRELLNVQEIILDKENKLTTTEDIKITTNILELKFPGRIYNRLHERMTMYEIFRDNLLKSSIKFLKIK